VSARVAVVGGGIVGIAVALAAVDRGHEVLQIERDEEPRGASVRNFGLVWICGRAAGRELALALRGRQRWQEVAPRAGLEFRPVGCLLVAQEPGELDLIAAA
jgi:glycine/D-amino acid oxidase-like deaminating enzyme